jgi:hypothetical protein
MQGGGEFFMAFGGVAACGVAPLGPLELGGCAGFEAGVLHGHGVHVLRPLDATEPWLALSPSARVLLPLGPRFALRLDAGPTIPLLRPQFYFYPANPAESGTVYQPSPATFRALLGGELRF